MSNQLEQHDSDTESNHGSGLAPPNTSSSESHSNSNRDPEPTPTNASSSTSHSDSAGNSNLSVYVGSPPFLEHLNGNNGPSFKQWLAMSLVYSIGKSAWDTMDSRNRARERQRRREEREAREAAEEREREERERREREMREALERLMQELGVDISNPVVSEEDISEARSAIGYEPGARNIVFAGKLNAGKSSLINAIRNLTSHDDDYAPTGASEVTLTRHRYPDPIHNGFVWYDTRGSGTENLTAFNHYYSQQLYAYDLVVLVHDTTLTHSDIRILQVCHLMEQPWLAVRTKCDMHIHNYEIERGCDIETAKAAFLTEVEDDVSRFTQQAEASGIGFVAQFRDFVVSATSIRHIIGSQPLGLGVGNALVDEIEFLQALGLAWRVADDAQLDP